MKACPVCNSSVDPVLSFGRMPLANGFLRQELFSAEFFFELVLGFCGTCALVQLIHNVPPEKMFHENYPFFTSSSGRMVEHFRRLGDEIVREWLSEPDPFVVELGTNDGTALERFAASGIRHL